MDFRPIDPNERPTKTWPELVAEYPNLKWLREPLPESGTVVELPGED